MGYYKELSGLAPETEYQFTVQFKLATNVENDMIGIGGAPGESVFVKCGVASEEPENSLSAALPENRSSSSAVLPLRSRKTAWTP